MPWDRCAPRSRCRGAARRGTPPSLPQHAHMSAAPPSAGRLTLALCAPQSQYITGVIEEQGMSEELNPSAGSQRNWEITAWVALALTLLMMVFTLVMCKRVKIAVACMKASPLLMRTTCACRHSLTLHAGCSRLLSVGLRI